MLDALSSHLETMEGISVSKLKLRKDEFLKELPSYSGSTEIPDFLLVVSFQFLGDSLYSLLHLHNSKDAYVEPFSCFESL